MNARLDHSPIAVGKVLPNHARTFTPVLEPARAQPCYEGADDMAAYAQTMPRHIKPTDIDALTTQAERRETTIRRMVNDHDQADAVEWLVGRGEISADMAERISEVAMEMAEKRLNRSAA